MGNPYKGEVGVELGGKTYNLVFTWETLTKVFEKHGNDIFGKILNAPPNVVASVLVAGLQDSELTVEDIMKESPPVMTMMKAIDKAASLAYFGPAGPESLTVDKKKSVKTGETE